MVEHDFHETPNMYPNLSTNTSNEQQFRSNKINEMKDYFIAEIKERKLMSKTFSKYIASSDYFDQSLIVLSVATGSIYIASFATVIGAPVGMMSASCSLAFSVTTGFVKKFLKTTRNKKKKHNKIVMLARSKLNSIESKISKALMDNEISHEDFETIINEEKKYRELKESIRMMNSQRSDVEKISLIEEGQKVGINEVIKRNEIKKPFKIISTCKYKMKSYCLKCRKDTENINPRVSNTSNGRTMILSKCAICSSKKSRFIKNQKAKGLLINLGVRTPLSKVPILGEILF